MRRLLAPLLVVAAALVSLGPIAPAASGSTTSLPTVTGSYGTPPTVKFPNSAAPGGLQAIVLSTGKGDTVTKGESLVVNYLGQIWRGKIFDSSFQRQQTFGIPIGVGAVVKGWDEGLVGKRIGSRVLLTVPPSLGYGSAGNPQAGIKGTDTLVFVVDLVDAYPKTVGTHEIAKVITASAHGVTISNINSSAPTLKVAKGTPKPTTPLTTVLARGSGTKVTPGMLILQYVISDFTGKTLKSTWQIGTPDGEYVGSKLQSSVLDPLVGDTIGSRVLIEVPATKTTGGPYLFAVQIAAEVPAKASKL